MEIVGRLSNLEQTVLAEIARQYPEAQAALMKQLEVIWVIKRENTGAGFFTGLSVNRHHAGPVALPRVIGKVWATVAGCDMTFLLFIENGYCSMLEGASIDGDTSKIDFDVAPFAITQR